MMFEKEIKKWEEVPGKKKIKITTKNKKEYVAYSCDGEFWRVYSVDGQQAKSCGWIQGRQVTNTKEEVNGGCSPRDIAEYLATRGF